MGKTANVPGTVFISEADQYLFAQGTHYDIYKKLGAHLSEENGKKGVMFAVWAPHAQGVHVVGSFNGWDESAHPMEKLGPGGIYKAFVPGIGTGEMYKFLITTKDGRNCIKRIRSRTMRSCVREPLPSSRICPKSGGPTGSGWRNGIRKI